MLSHLCVYMTLVCVARRWAHHAAQELKESEGAVSTTNFVLKTTDALLNCGLRLAAAMWLYTNICAGPLVNECKAFSMAVHVFAGTSAGEALGHFLHYKMACSTAKEPMRTGHDGWDGTHEVVRASADRVEI